MLALGVEAASAKTRTRAHAYMLPLPLRFLLRLSLPLLPLPLLLTYLCPRLPLALRLPLLRLLIRTYLLSLSPWPRLCSLLPKAAPPPPPHYGGRAGVWWRWRARSTQRRQLQPQRRQQELLELLLLLVLLVLLVALLMLQATHLKAPARLAGAPTEALCSADICEISQLSHLSPRTSTAEPHRLALIPPAKELRLLRQLQQPTVGLSLANTALVVLITLLLVKMPHSMTTGRGLSSVAVAASA